MMRAILHSNILTNTEKDPTSEKKVEKRCGPSKQRQRSDRGNFQFDPEKQGSGQAVSSHESRFQKFKDSSISGTNFNRDNATNR